MKIEALPAAGIVNPGFCSNTEVARHKAKFSLMICNLPDTQNYT